MKKADIFRLSGEVTGPLIAIGVLALLLLVRVPTARRFLVERINRLRK